MNSLILTKNQVEEIKNLFLNTELMCDVDFQYYLEGAEVHSVECIETILDSGDVFNHEIIYYNKAMEFLMRYDPSLKDSLDIASDLCFNCSDLSSELLASLLGSQIIREEFMEYYTELQELIEEYMAQIN
jgi:hypothetical protein